MECDNIFYGRLKEIELIRSCLKDKNNSILIYGKRRVGKTTLIKETINKYKFLYFECFEDTI